MFKNYYVKNNLVFNWALVVNLKITLLKLKGKI